MPITGLLELIYHTNITAILDVILKPMQLDLVYAS